MATGARCNEWMQIFQPETLCVWLRGQILHPRRRAVRNRDCYGSIKWLQGNQLHLHCVDCRVQSVEYAFQGRRKITNLSAAHASTLQIISVIFKAVTTPNISHFRWIPGLHVFSTNWIKMCSAICNTTVSIRRRRWQPNRIQISVSVWMTQNNNVRLPGDLKSAKYVNPHVIDIISRLFLRSLHYHVSLPHNTQKLLVQKHDLSSVRRANAK